MSCKLHARSQSLCCAVCAVALRACSCVPLAHTLSLRTHSHHARTLVFLGPVVIYVQCALALPLALPPSVSQQQQLLQCPSMLCAAAAAAARMNNLCARCMRLYLYLNLLCVSNGPP
jgi:hypothetical protein